jgi:hypothetical protein
MVADAENTAEYWARGNEASSKRALTNRTSSTPFN